MRKIRILYVISSLNPSAPDTVMMNIIRNMDSNEFSISVLTLSMEDKGNLRLELENMGVKCYSLGVSRKMFPLLGMHKAKKIIKELAPDIIHTHCIRSTILIGYMHGIDVIKCTTIHSYPHLDYVYGYGKLIGGLSGWLMLSAIKNFDYRIACSEAISKELLIKFGISTDVIHNGVSLEKTNFDKEKIKKKLGIPLDAKVIINVGAITHLKNTLFLVRAIKKSMALNLYAVFCGDGKERYLCEQEKNKNAIFLGQQKDVCKYLAIADIYVSASHAEGMPLSVLEALNAGLPILLSDIAPHREILDSSSKHLGKLFRLNDQKDFIDKLSAMLCDGKLEEMSQNAMEIGRKLFSASLMGENYKRKYLSAVKG